MEYIVLRLLIKLKKNCVGASAVKKGAKNFPQDLVNTWKILGSRKVIWSLSMLRTHIRRQRAKYSGQDDLKSGIYTHFL